MLPEATLDYKIQFHSSYLFQTRYNVHFPYLFRFQPTSNLCNLIGQFLFLFQHRVQLIYYCFWW